MTETTRLAYRATTFNLLGDVNPLSADRGRRVTIRPHTVEVTEWPDGRVYVTVQGQTIRQDGTRGSTRRCIRYRAADLPSWHGDDPPASEAPVWVQRIASAASTLAACRQETDVWEIAPDRLAAVRDAVRAGKEGR